MPDERSSSEYVVGYVLACVVVGNGAERKSVRRYWWKAEVRAAYFRSSRVVERGTEVVRIVTEHRTVIKRVGADCRGMRE